MSNDGSGGTDGEGSTVIRDVPLQYANTVRNFFTSTGVSDPSVKKYTSTKDSYSDIITGLLKVHAVERGRVSCSFSVLPLVANFYKGLHGGAAAAVAERISIACARTLVAEEKELFLGELGISYLSAAPENETLTVEANVVRSGRNLTVVSMEFRQKKTGKLILVNVVRSGRNLTVVSMEFRQKKTGKLMYTARSTFYHLTASKL